MSTRKLPADPATAAPWWRHGLVWLVVGLPASAVIAGLATLGIALFHPDPVLDTAASAGAERPAQQARNHAAEAR